MADILLIQPPIRDFYLTSKRTIPYGLACIAASIISNGFTVEIFDALSTSKSKIIDYPKEFEYLKPFYKNSDISPFGLFHKFKHFGYSFEHIGNIAKKSQSFLIGISSLFTPYSDEAIITAEYIKKFYPTCKIVLGGHHPTSLPLSVINSNAVDFVLRGEGETSMPLLAKAVKENEGFEKIPGIVFKRQDGTIYISKSSSMDNIDGFPLPAINLINNNFYKRGNAGSTVIITGRGCPLKCTYCSVNSSEIPYRKRSVDSVIKEMDIAITKFNARFIDFEDENLSFQKNWFLELLEKIKKNFCGYNLELRAMNGLYPPAIDEEIIQKMKETGFKTVNLSLGTTCKDQLKKWNRKDVSGSLDNCLELAEKYGLDAVCYIIVGAPFQNWKDSISDMIFLAQRRTLLGVSVFYPSPGSKDYDLCEDSKLLPEKFSMMRSSALPLSKSRLESITLLRLSRIINFMKFLVDIEDPLYSKCQTFKISKDKIEIGKKLIDLFFKDGNIRGINKDGEIYSQLISKEVTNTFINSLINIQLSGIISEKYVIKSEL
ncbi:MAG: B12-binding domain-containing radical SAM protein [Desulfobacterales bacterium]|nr:B12-binding domain-containing radical SAM protein [Desulfobacterales bacterium]